MDLAQRRAEILSDEALDAHRRRVIGPEHRWCVDCGEEIPEDRRRAVPGTMRCIECQTRAERRR
ncbi:TraR/DksA C4-type zinc finger protein [Oleomonas cavernae]|nr:TraR/DksA C4-type zinc finger protein [Oleomonas cavernae]